MTLWLFLLCSLCEAPCQCHSAWLAASRSFCGRGDWCLAWAPSWQLQRLTYGWCWVPSIVPQATLGFAEECPQLPIQLSIHDINIELGYTCNIPLTWNMFLNTKFEPGSKNTRSWQRTTWRFIIEHITFRAGKKRIADEAGCSNTQNAPLTEAIKASMRHLHSNLRWTRICI